MSFADNAANKVLMARVEALEAQVKDLTRRMDDQSKAHRLIAEDVEKSRTLTLKKSNG
jgi:cell division protein FtsB